MATVAVFCAWLLFGGTHLLMSWPPVRQWLANKFGAVQFIAIYTLIAAVSLVLLALTVAYYGGHGPRGLGLSSIPAAKWGLGAVAFVGAALAAAGFVNFPQSAVAVLARRMRSSEETKRLPLSAPSTIERVTRHPFFVGLALLMATHALMAKTLPGAIFFAGFTLVSLIGIPMQDRKLRERHGRVYGAHVDATSAVPFATTRVKPDSSSQRIWPAMVAAILGAVLLTLLHPIWRLDHGAWFAIVVVIGGLFAVIKQVWRSRNM